MPKMPDHELAIAFGPPKEEAGPSSVCRRLAGLLGVPSDKLDEFEHLLGAYMDEREADEHEDEPEEGDGYDKGNEEE